MPGPPRHHAVTRILLVDSDQEGIGNTLVERLGADPEFDLYKAATAADGLTAARSLGPFDVAIVEKELPDQSGLLLLEEIKKFDPNTEVILFISDDSQSAAIEAIQSGAFDYLVKPIHHVESLLVKLVNAKAVVQLHRQQKQLLQKLARSEERYTQLFEASPDAIVIFDRQSRQILDANSAALRLYGYERSELTELVASDIQEKKETRESWLAYRHSGAGIWTRNHRRKDGTVFPVEGVSGHLLIPGQRMVVDVIRDVSDRIATETAKQRLEAKVRNTQKMEAVGRLAGGVAHDFNNLLFVMMNCATFALENLGSLGAENIPDSAPELQAEIRSDLDQIIDACGSATQLTRQLLSLCRKQTVTLEVFDANAELEQMERRFAHQLGQGVQIDYALDRSPCPVEMDRGHFIALLGHLADNARDAMTGGGIVTIFSGTRKLGDKDAHSRGLPSAGTYVRIEFRDNGAGMKAEVLSRAFEPFFTTKEPGVGTGLGLATVHDIVEQSGGSIHVTSQPGAGTCFEIFLPVSTKPLSEAHIVTRSVAYPARGETILLVEDDDRVRRQVHRVLKRAGYHVLEARSGTEALRQAVSHRVRILLVDVVMPGMPGPQLAARLAKTQPAMHVIYMSGYADSTVREFGDLGRASAFLTKPFSEDRVMSVLREILDPSTSET